MQPKSERLIFAVFIILVDALVFVVPIAGLFAAYVLVMRPPWFRQWVEQMYQQ